MKSLRYRLCGRPAKFDDCLDRARRNPPSAVALVLTVEEVVHELQERGIHVEGSGKRFALSRHRPSPEKLAVRNPGA